MSIVALILAIAGFALFASGSEPHARRFPVAQDKPAKRRRRYAGGVVLAAAFPPAIIASGWIFGPILWSGMVMLGAGLVFVTLNLLTAR